METPERQIVHGNAVQDPPGVSVGQSAIGAAMGTLSPLIVGGQLQEADLYQALDDLRLPARFLSDLMAHLEAMGISVLVPDDAAEDDDSGFDRDGLSVFLERAAGHPILTAHEERRLAAIIAEGRLAETWLASGQVPERAVADLRRKVRAADQASNEFVRCNLKLVVSIARKMQGRGLDLDDLIQEGQFGLATAVRKFDPELGYKFSTYASWWIRQSISRAIADRGSAIRLPVHMHERVVQYATMLRRLHSELARAPSQAEMADALDWPQRDLREVQRASALKPSSLDRTIGERLRVGDVVADPQVLAPEEAAVVSDVGLRVRELLEALTERNRRVIELRFGLADGRVHTLEEIGETLGLTRERIRQLEVKALRTLRQIGRGRGLAENEQWL